MRSLWILTVTQTATRSLGSMIGPSELEKILLIAGILFGSIFRLVDC